MSLQLCFELLRRYLPLIHFIWEYNLPNDVIWYIRYNSFTITLNNKSFLQFDIVQGQTWREGQDDALQALLDWVVNRVESKALAAKAVHEKHTRTTTIEIIDWENLSIWILHRMISNSSYSICSTTKQPNLCVIYGNCQMLNNYHFLDHPQAHK